MKTLTVAIEDETFERAKRMAAERHLSVEALIGELLTGKTPPRSLHWLEECFRLMDQADGDSRGATWTRDDLYNA
ncbi:MAG: hypothetical protein NTW86_13145 [Candidatus Sumerlaeota bacterium]|nr:hypothetical protein [Candidatus Sumerlaeota bacterium]